MSTLSIPIIIARLSGKAQAVSKMSIDNHPN